MSSVEIQGTWEFTADEMYLLGLRTGDVLGPGVVGFATDDLPIMKTNPGTGGEAHG